MASPAKKRRRMERRLTEQRNAASKNLDRMTAMEIVRLMNREDRKVTLAVGREIPAIARDVDAIVSRIRNGGRLFYVGAGSSGRMGVLDAAECKPTFGVSPKLVQALVAGGRRAVTGSVEGAEDSIRTAERDLRERKLARNDVAVGISASGTTPYVLGAIRFARKRGAATVAITSDRRMPLARLAKVVIAPEVGPEVVAGATRLKAGTAQKMGLKMLSTPAVARVGHVDENLMVEIKVTNEDAADTGLWGGESSGRRVRAGGVLTREPVKVHKVPKVRDLMTRRKLLPFMGAKVSIPDFPASDYTIESATLNDAVAPYELVKTMRASILTLGPLMGRASEARVSLPGGCAIGARPIDLHLSALEKMGAEIATSHGYIEANIPGHGRL